MSLCGLVCQCGASKFYKDGLRKLRNGEETQRYLCRVCGRRVSFPQNINIQSTDNGKAQISATGTVKNLYVPKREHLGTRELNDEEKATIKVFEGHLTTQGYLNSKYPNNLKTLLYIGSDLNDPESVKTKLGAHPIKNGAKLQYVYAYEAFMAWQNGISKKQSLTWTRSKYRQEETIPFIPEEGELDQIIAAAQSRRMAAYLQTLKETFTDPSEALFIEWRDINGNTISINHPVKGHRPRVLEVSNKLLAMLNGLPRISERVFNVRYHTMLDCYIDVRKRVARTTQNDRINYIELRTFRHWGGTMIAEATNGNVLTVMRLLGHKRVENSMKYINIYMLKFRKETTYDVITASTPDEITAAISAGFEFVCEKASLMFFRRVKRISAAGNPIAQPSPEETPIIKSKPEMVRLNESGSGDISRVPPSPSFSTVFTVSLVIIYLFWSVKNKCL